MMEDPFTAKQNEPHLSPPLLIFAQQTAASF
jgi:hypothetical protein